MPAEFQRIKAMFLAAVEKSSGGERDDFLKDACGADEVLRREVVALLRRHDQAGNFLEPQPHLPRDIQGSNHAAASAMESSTADAVSVAGHRVGPYKLLQKLGEGGMGAV